MAIGHPLEKIEVLLFKSPRKMVEFSIASFDHQRATMGDRC